MARDATQTRERLMRAGEELFARDGVDRALSRDIVRSAGQANDSAINYHFGSREGLLEAILDKHIALMENRRRALSALVDHGDLDGWVEALVVPTAERLATTDGRDFLRVISQLSDRAGVRSRRTPAAIQGTEVAAQLAALDAALREFPAAVRRERISAAILLLTSSLADRARRVGTGKRQELGHNRYVENLVSMIAALLRAPGS
jgi:AcrR family transcriptional regulator